MARVPRHAELGGTRRIVHVVAGASKAKLALSAAAMGLVTSVATVGAWSAWTVTDANNGNTFATNTILIDDNQGGEGGSTTATGTAMFNVTNLEPGSSSNTACMQVDFSGSASVSSLTLTAAYGSGSSSTLEGALTLTTAQLLASSTDNVTAGSNTNSGACTNYPSGTSTSIGTQSSALNSWVSGSPYTIASPVTKTWYKFVVSGLPSGDSSCATYCGLSLTINLTWTLTTT